MNKTVKVAPLSCIVMHLDSLVEPKGWVRRSALAMACRHAIATASLTTVGANAGQLTRYSYNENGQVLTVDGPRSDVNDITTYGYNDQGYRNRITNALGHTITLGDFTGRG